MNAKQFAKTKTIPTLERLLENIESGTPSLLIDDMTIIFSDSYRKLIHGDRKGLNFRDLNPYDSTMRDDAIEGVSIIKRYISDLLNCKKENDQLKKRKIKD